MQKPEELVDKIRREENDLSANLLRLEHFMMSADFIKISLEQKTLLEQQHKAMTEYKLILIKRAHRINWEAGRDKAAAEIKKATEAPKEPDPKVPEIDPERCKTCANAPVHWSTCHDCVSGSNWKDGLHWEEKEQDTENFPQCPYINTGRARICICREKNRCTSPKSPCYKSAAEKKEEDGTPSNKQEL
jgi:hypothetical protein